MKFDIKIVGLEALEDALRFRRARDAGRDKILEAFRVPPKILRAPRTGSLGRRR